MGLNEKRTRPVQSSSANPQRKGVPREVAKAKAVALIMAGKSQAEAAREVGVTPKTMVEWMRDPEVRERIDEAAASVIGAAREKLERAAVEAAQSLIDAANAGEWRAACALLDRVGIGPSAKQEVNHSGAVGAVDLASLSTDELIERLHAAVEKLQRSDPPGPSETPTRKR